MARLIRTAAGVTLAALILVLAAGLFANAAHASVTPVTPAREAAACAAVYHYHHIEAAYNQLVQSGGSMTDTDVNHGNQAWEHAWHLLRFADPDLRRAGHHYLYWGTGWSLIPWLCGSGQ